MLKKIGAVVFGLLSSVALFGRGHRISVPRKTKTLIASWYGPGFEGSLMACGLIFSSNMPVVASRDYPMGTCLSLRYEGNETHAVVGDRGPWIPGRDLDISKSLAARLGILQRGVAPIEVSVVGYMDPKDWRHLRR